jgi:hypothetical protein
MIPSIKLTAIALTALAILTLRPVCQAAEPVAMPGGAVQTYVEHQSHQGRAESCCASMGEELTALAAGAEPHQVKLAPIAALPLAWRQLSLSERPGAPLSAAPPPRSLPYHARSARALL